MFLKKATALALLALAPTLLAACGGSDGGDLTGSAVEDPSKPVDPAPGAPVAPPAEKPGESKPVPGGVQPGASGGDVTLLGYVQGLAPTRRVDLADMKDACRASVDCQADIAKFEAYLKTLCPAEADCKDAVGMLLYKERSPQQVAQQLYSASFPQAKDVVPAVENALGPDAGGAAGGDVVAPDTYDDALGQVADDLKSQTGTQVDMVQIGDLIVKIDPATGNAVTAQLTKDVAGVESPDPVIDQTAATLAGGGTVDAKDAADLIDAIAKGETGDAGADAGAGSDPAKPGAEPAAVDAAALHKAAESLRLGVGMTVDWTGVKGMLSADVAASVEGFASDTTLINSDTLAQLIAGKQVDTGKVADLLDEIAATANP